MRKNLEKSYILAIDQGTTSTRALIFNGLGEIIKVAQKDLPLMTPKSGWVEQDAEQIWRDVVEVCKNVMQDFAHPITSIGITNQRETTILWDKENGKPVHNAIVWQDRRTSDMCAQLKSTSPELEANITQKTGLVLDPYFSATKIAWILNEDKSLRARAEKGEVLFGTVESYLIWKMSSGKTHISDVSNAARTMLLDIETQKWSDELCGIFTVPNVMLPKIVSNAGALARVDTDELSILNGVHITGSAGDQQSALFGQCCFEKGMMKSTYGTGCFALINTGKTRAYSQNKLLSTIAWRIPDLDLAQMHARGGDADAGNTSQASVNVDGVSISSNDENVSANDVTHYALEGSIFVAGAAIQFLRDNLGLIKDANESEALARSVEDTDGVFFVPALTGLGAPYWNAEARGGIFGLSRGTQSAHIVKAALDAQAYQTQDLMKAFCIDYQGEIEEMRVDGGLTNNKYVLQTIADITQTTIKVPAHEEATAWGAAALAGIGAGLYHSLDEIANIWHEKESYSADISCDDAGQKYNKWQNMVKRVQ